MPSLQALDVIEPNHLACISNNNSKVAKESCHSNWIQINWVFWEIPSAPLNPIKPHDTPWYHMKPIKPFTKNCNCLILPNGIYLSSSYIYYNLYFVTINNFFYKSININSKIEKSFGWLKPSAIEASCIPFQVLSCIGEQRTPIARSSGNPDDQGLIRDSLSQGSGQGLRE